MLKPTRQLSYKYRIAAMNERLSQNGICPGNHTVTYYNGWYVIDDERPRQLPSVTRRAKEAEARYFEKVFFNEVYNTYVLCEVDDCDNPLL